MKGTGTSLMLQMTLRTFGAAMLAVGVAGTGLAGGPFLEEPLVTDRPDFTESSSTVGSGVLQLEGGVTFSNFRNGTEVTSVFIELYGFNREEPRGPNTATFQTGLVYLINPDFQLDARVARRLMDRGVDFLFGVGLSWRLGG
jgi:hypothetical protein